jgi:hypothetical protein
MRYGAGYLVKSVISSMIMHMCLASMMMSLPASSHLATSLSKVIFSRRNSSTCCRILRLSSSVIFRIASCHTEVYSQFHIRTTRNSNCKIIYLTFYHYYYHQPINAPTAGAQAFLMDAIKQAIIHHAGPVRISWLHHICIQ